MARVRIDAVTLRAFAELGVDVGEWLATLSTNPWQQKGTISLVARRGNPCEEIIIGARTPDRHDLESYTYTDRGDAGDTDVAGRIQDGKLPIGPDVRYLAPGTGTGRDRESGYLMMGQVLPDTLARALVGMAATAAVGSPLLEGLEITGFDMFDGEMLPNGSRLTETRLQVTAGWTTVEVGELPEAARRKA